MIVEKISISATGQCRFLYCYSKAKQRKEIRRISLSLLLYDSVSHFLFAFFNLIIISYTREQWWNFKSKLKTNLTDLKRKEKKREKKRRKTHRQLKTNALPKWIYNRSTFLFYLKRLNEKHVEDFSDSFLASIINDRNVKRIQISLCFFSIWTLLEKNHIQIVLTGFFSSSMHY